MVSTPYTIQPGDTLTKIATRHGFSSWREIYNHPDNIAFRAKRPNPDRIFPGDIINIPNKQPAPITLVGTGQGLEFEEVEVQHVRSPFPGVSMTGTGRNAHLVEVVRPESVERDVRG